MRAEISLESSIISYWGAKAWNWSVRTHVQGFWHANSSALRAPGGSNSYIRAEGYPAAEMKHGPIAMIDEKTPTVFVIPSDSLYEKTFSNLEEIKARKGPIIALATEGNERIAKKVDDVIFLPPAPPPVFPLLAALPLQLPAYHIAVARGCDVDKPRNLAKSVTVE